MDLNAPLGKTSPHKGTAPPSPQTPLSDRPSEGGRSRRVGHAALAIGGLVAVGALAALGVALWTADPRGGEPYVVAAIPPQAAKPPRPVAEPLDPVATGSIVPNVTHAPPTATQLPDGASPVPRSPGVPLIIDVAKVLADREHGAGEPSPAAPVAEPIVAEPQVAIFVSGMGLSGDATRTATELMPSAVGFAFVPYGETVPAAVAAAKARGHEILLQVPMQNAEGGAPGPHALRPGEPAQEVGEDAAWLMGRIEGYDGVTNLLGAPVTTDRPVMGALLNAVAARGLFYLDDGTSKRSLGLALALAQGMPTARADIVLDATADPAVVHANLEALVAIAKRKGSAIGMASGLPDHLAAIAAFAAGLDGRGIRLVPVAAIVGRDATRTVAK